jgi:predicted  nucleic acid-binding Zn-ribbon protein
MMIVDLGRSSLTVSVVEADVLEFKTRCSLSNSKVGGRYFDRRIARTLELGISHDVSDLRTDPRVYQSYIDACERAKIELSTKAEATVSFTGPGGQPVVKLLTREEFETNICADLFLEYDQTIQAALEQVQMAEIDVIVMTGGGSQMPKLRADLTARVGKAPSMIVDPYLAVVEGAAILGAKLDLGEVVSVPGPEGTSQMALRELMLPLDSHGKDLVPLHDLDRQLRAALERIEFQDRRYDDLMTKLAGRDAEIERLSALLRGSHGVVAEDSRRLMQLGDDLQRGQRTVQCLTAQLAETERQLEDMRDDVVRLQNETDRQQHSQDTVQCLTAQLAAADEALRNKNEAVARLQDERCSLQEQNEQVTAKCQRLTWQKRNLKAILNGRAPESSDALRHLVQERNHLRDENTYLRNGNLDLTGQITALKSRLSELHSPRQNTKPGPEMRRHTTDPGGGNGTWAQS